MAASRGMGQVRAGRSYKSPTRVRSHLLIRELAVELVVVRRARKQGGGSKRRDPGGWGVVLCGWQSSCEHMREKPCSARMEGSKDSASFLAQTRLQRAIRLFGRMVVDQSEHKAWSVRFDLYLLRRHQSQFGPSVVEWCPDGLSFSSRFVDQDVAPRRRLARADRPPLTTPPPPLLSMTQSLSLISKQMEEQSGCPTAVII